MTSTRMVSPAAFARAVELARASLAGVECLVLSVQYGLPVPQDRIASLWRSIEMAREELAVLEMGAAGVGEEARVH